MEAGALVAVVVTSASALLAAGGALARLSSQAAGIRELQRGTIDQGKRIGDLENLLGKLEERIKAAHDRLDRQEGLSRPYRTGE